MSMVIQKIQVRVLNGRQADRPEQSKDDGPGKVNRESAGA